LLLAIESGDSSVLNVDVEKLVTVIKEVGGYLPEHEEHSDVPPPEVMQMSEQVDKEMVTQMATSMATRLASQMINQLAAGQLPPQMDPELASQLAENLSAAKEAAAQQGIIGQPAIMPQPPEEPMLAPIQTESTLTPPDIPTTQPSVKAPPVEQWINDLKNDNRLVKARAAQNLVAAGADAIESCINAILNEESVYHRRLLATIVKRIGPQGINAFNQTFQRDWNPPTFASLASVADIFAGNQPIMEKLSSLILHPDKIVRSATLSALANAPEDVKTRAIATGISSENIEIKNDAIKAVGELDLRSLTPQLLEIINKKTIIKMLPDTSVATAAIKALSDFKDNSTVGNIVEIAKPEGFFHFGKSLPESIHIEAINALADIGTPEAVEALKKISKSGKKAIKNAAAAALARVSAT